MIRNELISRAAATGIDMSREQAEQFAIYHDMLTRANENMNLTRVSADIDEAIDRNYIDSLTPLPLGILTGKREIIDVGSGAGFPGVPLAIMLPGARVTLLDSLDKRVRFLSEVIKTLGLNARATHMRAEHAGVNPDFRERFDCAVSRAVAGIATLAELTLPLVKLGGSVIMYKGPQYAEELDEARNAIAVLGGGEPTAHAAIIPNRDWAHWLIEISKLSPTPDKYPRRAGIPEKRAIK